MNEQASVDIEKDSYLEFNNLPNRLTVMRILVIPIVLGCLFLTSGSVAVQDEIKSYAGWTAAWLFAAAAITDFFDGYIARKRNIVTVFGSFLDPIADKFIVVSSLIMLAGLNRVNSVIVIILVLREMYMTSLRLLASNEGLSVPVNDLGKWKTVFQMLAIPFIMANETWQGISFPLVGTILIYLASFLAMWSAIQYSFSLIGKLKEDRKQKRIQKRQEKIDKKNAKMATKDISDESNDSGNS